MDCGGDVLAARDLDAMHGLVLLGGFAGFELESLMRAGHAERSEIQAPRTRARAAVALRVAAFAVKFPDAHCSPRTDMT